LGAILGRISSTPSVFAVALGDELGPEHVPQVWLCDSSLSCFNLV